MSKKISFKKNISYFPLRTGLLKKFLAWIAKGADESHMGKSSCPS